MIFATRHFLADYIYLTKPKIISLLVLGSLAGIFPAAQGDPDLLIIIVVIVGGSLAAGGANAINQALERDIDALMLRTRNRPVPSGRINVWQAISFGVVLNVIAFLTLWTQANLVAAGLTISGTLFYIIIYTLILKRMTSQNIVIGGAAGSVPPMVGWAAVTGGIDLASIYLFAIIFMWTPPHFWALSMLIKDDYRRASVPMLPVVKSAQETAKMMVIYTVILIPVSLLPGTTKFFGWTYVVSAALLGSFFLLYAVRHYNRQTPRAARDMYLYSLAYLAALFIVAMIDSVIGF